jgi:hypothetical protein
VLFSRAIIAVRANIALCAASFADLFLHSLQPAPLQTPTAVAQIGAIGAGKAIPSLNDEEQVAALLEAVLGIKPEAKPNGSEHNTEASYEKGN